MVVNADLLEGRDDADGVVERLVVLAVRKAHDTGRQQVLWTREEGRSRDYRELVLLAELVRELVVRILLKSE